MKTLAQEGWVLKPNITKSHSELLDTDLAHVGAKIIPADFASVTIMDGPKIFQFKRVKDVSHTKISHENGSNKSMFRITLSDGTSTCSAMNLQPIPGLSGKVYPGTKFRIKSGGAQVLGGFLLLTPGNCEVIGGRVEKLVENIEKNENISKKKSGEDGGPPKFVPFGSSANNGTTKIQVTLEKPGKQETDIQNGGGTHDLDRNSRNDKKNSDRGQKSDYQKDRRGKSYEKRGQSTRNTDDHKGQSYNPDVQASDDRGRNRNRGTHKSDFRGSSRGNYHNDDHQSNRDRSEDGSQGSGRSGSRGRGRNRGEDDSHSSGRSRGRGRNKGGDSGRSRGRGRDRGDDSYSSDRSRGRDRGSRGRDRSGRDDNFTSDRTQTPGFSLGDVLGDFPALGGGSQTGGASQAIEAVDTASEWSNSRGDGQSGGYEDRGGSRGKFRGHSRDRGDDDSGRSRGRGRGRDRDDYSPERARPTNFSLGDVMQDLDFPALGSDSPASGAGQAREEVQSGSDWSNLRDGGGSRGYDDRDGRDNISRGRGRGSRDRGSRGRGGRGSRRDDYSSGQSKPAVYKADLESDFPSLGGGAPAPAAPAAPAATNISTKSKGPASKNITNVMVDDEGFEIHDHLLYDDNGPPHQMHDPSLHKKQGYSSYRSSSDLVVEKIREMTVSDNMPSHSGKDRASHGGGSSARASKSQDIRRKDPEKRSDEKYRSGGHGGDSQQSSRGYGRDNSSRRDNDHYDQRYDGRSDQRRDDRYDGYRDEQRDGYRNDRYDDSSNIQYTDRRDDRYNPGRTTSNRSNLTGNRGRSSGGGYRRY